MIAHRTQSDVVLVSVYGQEVDTNCIICYLRFNADAARGIFSQLLSMYNRI